MTHASQLKVTADAARATPEFIPAVVETIRADVFAGYPTREIAERHGVPYSVMEVFLATRRGRWLSERRSPYKVKRDRIVLFRPRSRRDGGYDIRPFSVARISMHVAALEGQP